MKVIDSANLSVNSAYSMIEAIFAPTLEAIVVLSSDGASAGSVLIIVNAVPETAPQFIGELYELMAVDPSPIVLANVVKAVSGITGSFCCKKFEQWLPGSQWASGPSEVQDALLPRLVHLGGAIEGCQRLLWFGPK